MLTVVAPASMAASTTSQRKSISVRAASSGLNSTSAQYALGPPDAGDGPLDDLGAWSSCSLCSRWMAEVARKTWIRGFWAYWSASQARSMSRSLQRARPQTRRAGDLGGDGADGLEVAGRGDREPGLDDVDAERREGPGHLHLLGHVHARARRLLAVAQGRVEDPDPIRSSAMAGSLPLRDRVDRTSGASTGSGKTEEAPRSAGRAGLGASWCHARGVRRRRTLRPRPAE